MNNIYFYRYKYEILFTFCNLKFLVGISDCYFFDYLKQRRHPYWTDPEKIIMMLFSAACG